ncbi:MAG: Fic family protein [Chitinophagales bacterium]|jgi:Fic family protein|nr:Fic family protein [Sphingobacteriales bacterium]MBP6665115.1 Fic family protein [Chitinophagales bacterium]MBP7533028.1 Fic family protein [Chitinophagales bacterium]
MELQLLTDKYLPIYGSLLKINLKNVFAKINKKAITLEDYNFYTISSAIYSSNIEGNSISVDTYFRHLESKHLKPTRDVKEIEDLIKAYNFAQNNKLSLSKLLKAHGILSKNVLIKSASGKLRTQMVAVYNGRKIEYVAVEPTYVKIEMEKLFADIKALLKTEMDINQVFYYASLIHLVFLKIHPFMDGNGRSARLIEKWFLAEKLGENAWSILSEQYYHKKKAVYYKNVHIGGNYYVLNYELCVPFLLMLPQSLIQ